MTAYDTLPRPSPDQLMHVEMALRAVGGHWLDATCEPKTLPPVPNTGVPEGYTCGCTGQTLCQFPYVGADGETQWITLCAVCDAAYLIEWDHRPRAAV